VVKVSPNEEVGMQVRRVAVLGGGPGGLYAARLLKLADPTCAVTVHEQGEPDATFGFGVGLAAGTQRKLEAADPDTLREIVATGYRHDMTMRVGDDVARVHNDRLVGVARTELLAILQRHAEKAGVELEFGSRRTVADLDADVVIAADGVGSATREQGSFGAHVETGRGLYLWCGTDFPLDDAVFAPVETEHGVFVTHAYPYSGGRQEDGSSTFLVETDEATWRRAGFDATDVAPDGSDEVSLRYLERAFAVLLRGRPLIGNRTRWLRFRTVRCDRWSDGRTVLLGDAAHTAHYSIGSGTKLAMEDAIALVEALREPESFATYERVRRPAVERLQELARRSQLWWESFADRLHLPVDRLMVAYMSRAGNVPLERFAATGPDVVQTALRRYGGDPGPAGPAAITDWVIERQPAARDRLEPIDVGLVDPWDAEGDAVVARALGSGAAGFRLTGPSERGSVLTRLDLAERLRSATGRFVEVDGPAQLRDDLAAGLVSGRADRVTITEEEA
jgi:anthraniloyl-CoA monooxygenase